LILKDEKQLGGCQEFVRFINMKKHMATTMCSFDLQAKKNPSGTMFYLFIMIKKTLGG